MKVFPAQLKTFLPKLDWSTEELASNLSMIGHEAEIVSADELEVKVFPNRGDVLSLRGLSRDLAALYPEVGEWRDVMVADLPVPQDFYPLTITASAKPFIIADHLLRVDAYRPTKSPNNIIERLKPLGLQPKSLLIDLTNIIAYEVGVPLHAFDFDTVKGGVAADLSVEGEKFQALNGKHITLRAGALVLRQTGNSMISDLLGTMGGADSAVNDETATILLQAGAFDGKAVRRNTRLADITTEASYRYQRGVDPELLALALARFVYLLQQAAPSIKVSNYQVYQNIPKTSPIPISSEYVSKILGIEVSTKNLQSLTRLGFQYEDSAVSRPSWRFDIEGPIDVAEEVARIIGLNNIAPKQLSKTAEQASTDYRQLLGVKDVLMKRGFTETSTYSFTSSGPLKLHNPRTVEQAAMRSSLKEGLLQTLHKNPYLSRTLFFEVGAVFEPEEQTHLGLITSGYNQKQLDELAIELQKTFNWGERSFAEISTDERARADVKQPKVFYLELETRKIKHVSAYQLQKRVLPKYKRISKFPPVVRDVTLLVEATVKPDTITRVFEQSRLVLFAELVDVFESEEKFGHGMLAYTFRALFQDLERSLIDEEVTKELETIFHNLSGTVKFEIR